MLLALALAATHAQDPGTILIDRNRIDRAKPPAPAPRRGAQARGNRNVAAAPAAPAPIKGIRFQGAQAPEPVARAAEKFLGKVATRETLEDLAAALSEAYEDTDVALYTIGIPEQDFSDGSLTVSLTEGRLASAQVKSDDPKAHRLLRARLAPLLDEKPLSRPTMERQFTLIRSQPGMTIDTQFADPEANGALALTVTPKQRRSKFSFGFSNRGIELLSDGQFDARAEFYGLARDGDQLSLAGSAASDFERYRYGSLAYGVPLRADGLTLSANAAYLETRPKSVPIRGTAKLAGVSVSYPVIRSFRRSGDLSLGIDGIDSDNAAFGSLIATERTRAVRGAASWSEARAKRSIAVSGSVSQGLDMLGARATAPLAETGFFKANAAAYAAQAIGKRIALRANVTGQFTRDRLPAAERFAVGGESLGRAFDTGFITADRGAGALGEIAFRPIRSAAFGDSEVYGFVDGAWVGILRRGAPGRDDYSMGSAGAGARARFRDKAELGLEYAHVIDQPYAGFDDDWRVSVYWRLSL